MDMKEVRRNFKKNTNTVSKRKGVAKKEMTNHHTRKDFWCSIKSKTKLVKVLSQYLKEDGNTIANIKNDADARIGGPASVFECEKRCYCVSRRHIHIYTILHLPKKEMGEIFMKVDMK